MKKLLMLSLLIVASGSAFADKADAVKPQVELKQMTETDYTYIGKLYSISPTATDAAMHVINDCRLLPTQAVIGAMLHEKHEMQSFLDAAAAKHDNKEMPSARKEDCQALQAVAKL